MNFFVRNETNQSFIDAFSLRTWYALSLLGIVCTIGIWWYTIYLPLSRASQWYAHENNTLKSRMSTLKQKQSNTEKNKDQSSVHNKSELPLFLEEHHITPASYAENTQSISITVQDNFFKTVPFLEQLMHHEQLLIEQYSMQKGKEKNSITMHCTMKKLTKTNKEH